MHPHPPCFLDKMHPICAPGKGQMHPTLVVDAPHPRVFYQTCALFPKKCRPKGRLIFLVDDIGSNPFTWGCLKMFFVGSPLPR